MPRPVVTPEQPVSPGAWLACFRYRHRLEGHLTSPEQLGKALGVSGDTVRRWETGLSQPSRTDLRHIGEICSLSPMEQAFLLDAFNQQPFDDPPNPSEFIRQAEKLLSGDYPAFIHDSLFYVRASNNYAEMISRLKFPTTGENIVATIFEPPLLRNKLGADRLTRMLREFWFCTASLCGSPHYVETLRLLLQNEEFRGRWSRLAMDVPQDDDPICAPYYFDAVAGGTFRVYVSIVAIPPNYFLREYMPLDEIARQRMAERRAMGERGISIAERIHWAQS
jgi:transcriptional regulator with XRE-family HTH domain